MFKILKKRNLAPDIFSMVLEAPRVAKAANPGQFVIVRAGEKGERIPLTICDYDAQAGTVAIVVQSVGASTRIMAQYEAGDAFHGFVGPLGQASEFVEEPVEELKKKKRLFVAGGVGAAPVYAQVKWLAQQGAKPDVIIGARSASNLILEDDMKAIANEVFLATDDGSAGMKGRVTDLIMELHRQGKVYDEVIAIGPMIMMKFVCEVTRKLNWKTIVSLNTLMVDGTGMCGACRVTVGGETRFACVDGPEFDGHLVDFDEAMRRQGMYKNEEHEKEDHVCKMQQQALQLEGGVK